MNPIDHPSPNHDARPSGIRIDMLVIHYTGMASGAAAHARLCDPEAKVSAHYLVEEDGSVYRLVAEERRAWHAGVACWRGQRDVNGRSIGIELVNPGHEFGYRDFPAPQMAALIALARDVLVRRPIPARNVVGHSDVAPARKRDPGERFDWRALAAAGIGLWPEPSAPVPLQPGSIDRAQFLLATYGYELPRGGALDPPTQGVLIAFQRHFRPACIDGRLDAETLGRLETLAGLCG